MIKLSTFFTAVALSTALVYAQRPGGFGGPGGTPRDPQMRIQMRVNFLTTLLTLTDDQKALATTIFTNAYTEGQTVSSNLKTAHQSLSDAVKTNNAASIDQISASIGTIEGQLTAINAKADAAFYAILTPAQKATYDAAPHGGRGGGPGRMGAFGQGGGPRNRATQ